MAAKRTFVIVGSSDGCDQTASRSSVEVDIPWGPRSKAANTKVEHHTTQVRGQPQPHPKPAAERVIDESKDENGSEGRDEIESDNGSDIIVTRQKPSDHRGAVHSVSAIRDTFQTARKERGLFELVAQVLAPTAETLRPDDKLSLHITGTVILSYTHADVLNAILEGNMARTYVLNENFQTLMHQFRLRQSGGNCPIIYVNQLATCHGHSPTPNELLSVIAKLRSYVNGSDLGYAKKIDAIYNSKDRKWHVPTYRKYMFTANGPSSRRIAKTNRFLAALRARCQEEVSPNEPLPGWLPEVGYTNDGDTRLRDHQLHHSSNYMMNLVEAALALEFPGKFQLFQFIVHFCQVPMTAAYAELLFTELACGFTYNGGGFNYHPPGLSNISARAFMTSDWEQWYEGVAKLCNVEENDRLEYAMQKKNEADDAALKRKIAENQVMIEEQERLIEALTAALPPESRQPLPSDPEELQAEIIRLTAVRDKAKASYEAERKRTKVLLEAAKTVTQILVHRSSKSPT